MWWSLATQTILWFLNTYFFYTQWILKMWSEYLCILTEWGSGYYKCMKKLKIFMPFGFPTNYFHRLPMLQICKVCHIKTSKQRKKLKLHNSIFWGEQLYIMVTVKYVLILFPFITQIFCNESKFCSLSQETKLFIATSTNQKTRCMLFVCRFVSAKASVFHCLI